MIFTERPQNVHVVRYLLPSGMRGTKNKVKNVRTLVTAWAAGV